MVLVVRRFLTLGLLLALTLVVGSARAELREPEEGAVVTGDVTIWETQGVYQISGCYWASEMIIVVLHEGEEVMQWRGYGSNGMRVTWPTLELPEGNYRIESWALQHYWAWPCSPGSWQLRDHADVVIDHPPTPTSLELVGPGQGHWREASAFEATLRDENGAPIANQSLEFSLGTANRSALTDDQGVARVELALDDLPATYRVGVHYQGSLDHLPTDASMPFDILSRPTSLAYDGDQRVVRGTNLTFGAHLVDATPGSAMAGAPVAGAKVLIEFDGMAVTRTTDAGGHADAQVLALSSYGVHAGTVSFAGFPGWAPSRADFQVEIAWEFVFTDEAGRGEVRLNTITQEVQVALPRGDLAVRSFDEAAGVEMHGPVVGRRFLLEVAEPGFVLSATFDLSSGAFSAAGAAGDEPFFLTAHMVPALHPPFVQPFDGGDLARLVS